MLVLGHGKYHGRNTTKECVSELCCYPLYHFFSLVGSHAKGLRVISRIGLLWASDRSRTIVGKFVFMFGLLVIGPIAGTITGGSGIAGMIAGFFL
jgi:hypothetical protein